MTEIDQRLASLAVRLLPMLSVRSFLNQAGWRPAGRAAKVAYRVVYGSDLTGDAELSLTERQGDEQIRFGLAGRVRRSLHTIVEDLPPATYQLCASTLTTAGPAQQDFFEMVIERHAVQVGVCQLSHAAITETEKHALDALSNHQLGLEFAPAGVFDLVDERLAVGDGRTAALVLDELVGHSVAETPRWMSVRGLAANQLGDTLGAERFFRRWATAGGLDLAKANYVLSMLYARHHPVNFRSNETAASLLDEALAELAELPSDIDVEFERVFNRNGMALINFRDGQVDAAIEKLVSGIARLNELGLAEGPHRMHASVLMYNLAQIYRRIGDYDNARTRYADVLEIDPNMAEYRVEFAEVLCHLGEFDLALAELDHAQALEPVLVSTADMRGWVLMTAGQFERAANAYDEASNSFGSNAERVYNRAFCLLQANEQSKVLAMTSELVESQFATTGSVMLVAQALLDTDEVRAATDLLVSENDRFLGSFDDAIDALHMAVTAPAAHL